jgi:hypothetical protein
MLKERPMKIQNFGLLLTYSEEVLGSMKDCGDHYCYTGNMNSVERLRQLVREARLIYDVHRLTQPPAGV